MSNALELRVFPKTFRPFLDGWHACRKWDFEQEQVRMVGLSKRLTDSELAAEYYRSAFLHENSLAENDGYDGMPETRAHRHQATMLWRFATLPHYDEQDQA